MGTKKSLYKAHKIKDDEFFTLYEDVANEVSLYKKQLKGKKIICPCDWDESQGGANDVVTVYGTNLSGVNSVVFYSNGQQSASLSSQSIRLQDQNHITFTISSVLAANEPAGVYQIKVVTPNGTSNAGNFTMNAWSTSQPTITNISPSQGGANTSATIYGTNLSGASSVMFYDSSGQNVASISSP
jgi:hypothetical protein